MYWLILALAANKVAGMCIPKGQNIIVDVGHNILPNFPKYTNDVLLFITLVFAFLNKNKFTPKYFKILAIMYLFRAVCVCLTVLPRPRKDDNCKSGLLQNCNDFIFSGHTTFNVVTSYFLGKPFWPYWPMITSLGTIGSRNHYTIDVALVWFIFFSLISNIK
jgi:hypothetical protein